MRLAMRLASEIRAKRPELFICFYGLYAPVSRDLTLANLADRAIGGEYEPELVRWVSSLDGDAPANCEQVVFFKRGEQHLPARRLLPPLERYARLAVGSQRHLVGYVEASHGCIYRCRHCPVPAVYDGTIRMVGREAVLSDIEQLVSLGARHITFGDPDFLNGFNHSLKLVRAMHERFPELTFDLTTKVEHVLRHRDLWQEFAELGCLFVVCAFESCNDDVLARLDKGHTRAHASEAVELLRRFGIEIRPSFMPFTPWTTIEDVLDILDFVQAHDMVENVDPVQYAIRLLLPEGSLLLDHPDMQPYLGEYDDTALTYEWHCSDARVDELQKRLSKLIEAGSQDEKPTGVVFNEIKMAALEAAAGRDSHFARHHVPAGVLEEKPRLTEPWFC
jgi:radical SAM superfamily enzyme YgiQ (UPF0313 family)